jgi:hypothetical protein
VTEGAAEFARFLRFWADTELRGYCPVYEAIARPLAEETALLERVAHVAPRQKIVPVLLFAAVKSLVDREPASPLGRIYADGDGDPWPPFRAMLDERFEEVAELLRTRRTQTNEVARASGTLLALGLVEPRVGRPLALVELGPSAGLNLLLDRFSYDYGAGRTAGDPASAVRLVCEIKGVLVPPIPAKVPSIGQRRGIDLDPVDVTDEVQTRWLEACLWPGAPARAERLRAALALARREPPRLARGSALELLPAALDSVPPELVPCVVCTWMLAYLTNQERATLAGIVERFASTRDVACVTAEFEGVSPWAPPPPRPDAVHDGRLATLLGMSVWRGGVQEARALAWMHPHGVWIDWLDRESALGLSLEA